MRRFRWLPGSLRRETDRFLGVSVFLSEHETHWKAFLQILKDRGMIGVKLVISDDRTGLGAARRAILGSVPWQRCQVHLQQNAGVYVTRQAMRMEVAVGIRAAFTASDRKTVEELLHAAIQK
jgi:putative transposase